jgi:hypothetical protein
MSRHRSGGWLVPSVTDDRIYIAPVTDLPM